MLKFFWDFYIQKLFAFCLLKIPLTIDEFSWCQRIPGTLGRPEPAQIGKQMGKGRPFLELGQSQGSAQS